MKEPIPDTQKKLPEFAEIQIPHIMGYVTSNGSGTKFCQSFFDGHPEILMIPAFPLMYFYPHWKDWEEELKNDWTWDALIDILCTKHASVIDSARIPGHNGLNNLGDNQEKGIAIDESDFRRYLKHFLKDQPISSRNFILAIHYAYGLCQGEDLSRKKLLLYHIHFTNYLYDYMLPDFPELECLAMTRDTRANIGRRASGFWNIDKAKLNATDAMILRKRAFYHGSIHALNNLHLLTSHLNPEIMRVIKHEELNPEDLPRVMQAFAKNYDLEYIPEVMLHSTFDGKSWWGDKIYDMKPTNTINPQVLGQPWLKTLHPLDIFVIEGMMFDYLKNFGYPLFKYTQDTPLNQLKVFLAILLPTTIERQTFIQHYLAPTKHIEYLRHCVAQATHPETLKDYTWNGTFRHKWTYIDLKLWKTPWYEKLLKRWHQNTKVVSPSHPLSSLSKLLYISIMYLRFLLSIFTYPFNLLQRIGLYYRVFFRQVRKTNIFPRKLI